MSKLTQAQVGILQSMKSETPPEYLRKTSPPYSNFCKFGNGMCSTINANTVSILQDLGLIELQEYSFHAKVWVLTEQGKNLSL